jgi:uncharacterized protein (DUF924 family)
MKTPQFLISLAAISGPSSEFEASTRIPIAEARAVVDFWRQAGSALWFGKDEAFDRRFRYRFLRLYEAAGRGEPTEWLATADGAFGIGVAVWPIPTQRLPRHVADVCHRHAGTSGRTYGYRAGHDRVVEAELSLFLYLPVAHSENLAEPGASRSTCAAPWTAMTRGVCRIA